MQVWPHHPWIFLNDAGQACVPSNTQFRISFGSGSATIVRQRANGESRFRGCGERSLQLQADLRLFRTRPTGGESGGLCTRLWGRWSGRWASAGSVLGQRRRRWPNTDLSLASGHSRISRLYVYACDSTCLSRQRLGSDPDGHRWTPCDKSPPLHGVIAGLYGLQISHQTQYTGPMLIQRRKRLANSKPSLVQRFVSADLFGAAFSGPVATYWLYIHMINFDKPSCRGSNFRTTSCLCPVFYMNYNNI